MRANNTKIPGLIHICSDETTFRDNSYTREQEKGPDSFQDF